MGRPRVKIDLELLRQLRSAGLGWRTIARRYYALTKQDICWMTLRKHYKEADLPIPSQEKQAHNQLQ